MNTEKSVFWSFLCRDWINNVQILIVWLYPHHWEYLTVKKCQDIEFKKKNHAHTIRYTFNKSQMFKKNTDEITDFNTRIVRIWKWNTSAHSKTTTVIDKFWESFRSMKITKNQSNLSRSERIYRELRDYSIYTNTKQRAHVRFEVRNFSN